MGDAHLSVPGRSTISLPATRRRAVAAAIAAASVLGVPVSAQTGAAPARQEAGGAPAALFVALDRNSDGAVTGEEMRATFDAWYTQWSGGKDGGLGFGEVFAGLAAVVPASAAAVAQVQSGTPHSEHVEAMRAALPARAPSKPRQARRVLVLGRAAGWVHSSIPLAARTIEEMGKKTGAWSTTITYDAADITEENLKQYDAIVLASTTGEFLDDPHDPRATAARRAAFVDFVRGGKGLVGIHAASDGYHRNAAQPAGAGLNWAVYPILFRIMAGDADADGRLTRGELAGLAGSWFAALDPQKSGRVSRADFAERLSAIPPPVVPAQPPSAQAPAKALGPDAEVGTWPEFNAMIGAIFKWHWNDGHRIPVKLDEPGHPLNAPFNGRPFEIVDETYTFSRNTYSRQNLRVLKSVDYARMSETDRAKEEHPRPDGDYALSWIRRDGKGRVFYEAHGHNEQVYAFTPWLEHLLAGMQYALGDLEADDRPSAPTTR